jgi:hypothetical protein
MLKLSKPNKSQDSIMKALIIYRDFAFAAKANAALQSSAQCADVGVQRNIRPWRADLLKFPPAAQEELVDAADVHLIVFASSYAQLPPFWLQDWLEQWAKCRQIKDVALAVIPEDSADELSPLATFGLSAFAKNHGFSFISGGRDAVIDDSNVPIGSLRETKLATSRLIRRVTDVTNLDSFRHHGINE